MIVCLTGVSKWNFKKWEEDGKPYLDRSGWCALCMVIAEKDLVNLEQLFKLAENLKSKL